MDSSGTARVCPVPARRLRQETELYDDVHGRTIRSMAIMTVSEARAALPELLTRVEAGEEVTITRHGRPVAVVVRPDILRPRAVVVIDEAARLHEMLTAARDEELSIGPGLTPEYAEELIREIRSGRDSR